MENNFNPNQTTPTENMVVSDAPFGSENVNQKTEVPQTSSIQTGANPTQNLGTTDPPPNNSPFGSPGGFNPQPNASGGSGGFNPQPNTSGGFSSPQNFGGGFHQNNNQPKYKIIDLFWLLNSKIEGTSEGNPDQNEAQFVSISYNIQFGNLRISFFNIPQGAIQKHVVFYNKLQRLTTGTVYASGSFRLLESKTGDSFTCLEQLFQETGQDWQSQRPMCTFAFADNITRLTIQDPASGIYFYDFVGWQKNALIECCKFATSRGLELSGHYRLENG